MSMVDLKFGIKWGRTGCEDIVEIAVEDDNFDHSTACTDYLFDALEEANADYPDAVAELELLDYEERPYTHEEAADRGYIELLLDGCRGIYTPKDFCENFGGWSGIDDSDNKCCLAGPDEEWYWEAWDNICQNATYTDSINGAKWGLWQDGDLFAVRIDKDINWEF